MTSRDKSTAPRRNRDTETVFHGIGVSPGVAVGPVFLAGAADDHYVERAITAEQVGDELRRLESAIIETRRQIKEIQKSVIVEMGHGDPSILDAHLLVLDDRAFVEEVILQIEKSLDNAETVVWNVADKYAAVLAAVEDDYLRERVADIKDVARRLVRNLSGQGHEEGAFGDLAEPSIVVANDLAPSETASLSKTLVSGFVTDLGSPTSHTAVMARSMEIPAVVGMHDITAHVLPGDVMLLDGNRGKVIINPTQASLDEYGKVVEERRSIESGLNSLRDLPAETVDGHRIVLAANIENPSDVETAISHGAQGVGLFRSEYAYLTDVELPSEDDVAAGYTLAARKLAPEPMIVRTLDLGGDKLASYIGLAPEANPFLGLRSIRFSLAEPEIFKTQLRAILRASAHGNVKIMYPMISSVDEVVAANRHLEAAKNELREAGIAFNEELEVGVMIETPSSALTADLIAPHVKFFSIGTNDLIQYAIAVDRVNERLAHLYQPTHPAILKLIRMTVEAGHRNGIWVGVCGEVAADPILCPLLVGMGVDELSVAPPAVPVVKDAVRSIRLSDAKELASRAMECRSPDHVRFLCRELIARVAPEILELSGPEA